jgi:hypothetical protein
MIPQYFGKNSCIYTLELIFSILTNHSPGFQPSAVAVTSARMYPSAGQQQTLRDHGLLADRDYDTEDAASQSETDEEADTMRRGRPLRTGQLTRVRHLSPVNLRDSSSRVVTVSRVDRNFGQVPRCLIQGCSFPARVSEGHGFCSRTCSRLVCLCLGSVYSICLNTSLFVLFTACQWWRISNFSFCN